MNKYSSLIVYLIALVGLILVASCAQEPMGGLKDKINDSKSIEEKNASCHLDESNPDCFCNEDEVRQHTVPADTKISKYICKISDCKEDSYCEEKFGDHYVCFKTDNRTPDKGFCGFGLITTD
ncbi:MAG: hypothetical protein AABX25_02455 [Nanoarchaeota archaeon]